MKNSILSVLLIFLYNLNVNADETHQLQKVYKAEFDSPEIIFHNIGDLERLMVINSSDDKNSTWELSNKNIVEISKQTECIYYENDDKFGTIGRIVPCLDIKAISSGNTVIKFNREIKDENYHIITTGEIPVTVTIPEAKSDLYNISKYADVRYDLRQYNNYKSIEISYNDNKKITSKFKILVLDNYFKDLKFNLKGRSFSSGYQNIFDDKQFSDNDCKKASEDIGYKWCELDIKNKNYDNFLFYFSDYSSYKDNVIKEIQIFGFDI